MLSVEDASLVGEVYYLLFIYRFEPHVLQVRSFPTTIMYERMLNLWFALVPDPSFQFAQQDQTRNDYGVPAYGQQGWSINPREFHRRPLLPCKRN